jgi:epoxide hydrolase-like predicted phosphatase
VTIEAVISDFGGVLTTPLLRSFAAVQDETGIPFETFGRALERIAERDGENPLFTLERGEITEERFLADLGAELATDLGHAPALHRFYEVFFEALHPNGPMVEMMRGLRDRGYRMALLTNNVREWEPVWRSKLPVDEIFEVVVDSAFVGLRKPEREIYELTLERLGGVAAEAALFVDDVGVNCEAARELGMRAVQFRDSEQAIAEIEEALSIAPPRR